MSEERFDRLEKMMEQLIQMVSHNNAVTGELRQEVGELRQEISDVKDKVIKLEQTVARIEHDHGNKISALFDGFTLRGDQIDRLQEHLDERLDAIQTDVVVQHGGQHLGFKL